MSTESGNPPSLRDARTILVTGASGFVGRRLAVRVREEAPQAKLQCLVGVSDDAFCHEGREHLRSHGIQPIECDLVTGKGLEGVERPDILFHLAANTHTWETDQRANDVGTTNLLAALGPLGPSHHVIFTGTVAILDNRKRLDRPLTEDTPVEGLPLSLYGSSKLRAEEHLLTLARQQGFRLSIARLSTVYGPSPRPNTFFVVLKREVERGSLISRLNWPGLTSFIHADDVAECCLQLARNPPTTPEPQAHLLATESQTLGQVSRILYRAKGLPFKPVSLPPWLWKLFSVSHGVCLTFGKALPTNLFNNLWRFDLIVNPVFDCDLESTRRSFPELKPKTIEEVATEL